jgi:hypothetical protein
MATSFDRGGDGDDHGSGGTEDRDRRHGRFWRGRRHEIWVDKSWDRLFDGEIGLSVDDGKKIIAALQAAGVRQEADTYTLFRRICPDCGVLRPVKDYPTPRIRTVFGSAGSTERSGIFSSCSMTCLTTKSRTSPPRDFAALARNF